MSVSILLFSQDIYQHLPQQRRLDDEDKQEVRELLNLKINKKLLQQHISESKVKVVTLRDISNVRKPGSREERNSLEAVTAKLKATEGNLALSLHYHYVMPLLHVVSTVDIFSDEENTFTGILFQDSIMKSYFASYPEVLMIDTTYKLNELRMPLYLMIVLVGNG